MRVSPEQSTLETNTTEISAPLAGAASSNLNNISSSRLSFALAALAMIAGLNCNSTAQRHRVFAPIATIPPALCPVLAEPEKLPAEIKNLHSGSVFKQLRESCVFEPEDMWAVTANSETFSKMGELMADVPKVQDLLNKAEINVLYPGAGVHLSPLDLLFQLSRKFQNLQKINLTFTEIDPKSYKGIDKQVQRLDQALDTISGLQITEEAASTSADSKPADPAKQPKIKTIKFNYQSQDGRPIQFQINYEYRMSGEKYFRTQSLADADLIINHDMDAGVEYQSEGHHAIFEYLSSYDSEWNKKPHLLLIETRPQTMILGNSLKVIQMPYGCGENHSQEKPTQDRSYGVTLLQLDTATMEAIKQQLATIYPDHLKRAWELFAKLSSGQKKTYEQNDIYAAWLGVRLYRESTNPEIKELTKTLLEELLEVPFTNPELNINLDTDDIDVIKEKIRIFLEKTFISKPSIERE
jgi:hypothetical protein